MPTWRGDGRSVETDESERIEGGYYQRPDDGGKRRGQSKETGISLIAVGLIFIAIGCAILIDAAVDRSSEARLVESYGSLQNCVIELASEDNRESLIRVNAEKDDCRELEAHLAEARNALNESAAYLGIPVRQETWIALEILMTDVTWSRDDTTEDVRVDTDGDGALDAEITGTVVMGKRPAETLTEVRMNSMPPEEEGELSQREAIAAPW